MGLLDDARNARRTNETPSSDPDTDTTEDHRQRQGAGVISTQERAVEVPVNGDTVEVEIPETIQTAEEGGDWLFGTGKYGRPRGGDALQNRQIVQTSAMQSIVNGIAGQVIGGELAFEGRDDVLDGLSEAESQVAEDLQAVIRDILEGPHLPKISLDELIVSTIEDMLGPGQGIWQPLGAADGSLPVVAIQALDPMTVRMNIDEHNQFGDPPYWQAPGAFSGSGIQQLQRADPIALQHDDVIVMSWPYGSRSYRTYPVSPAYQVREWLEILANSTTHHNRFYDDNQIPPGLLQVVNASDQTVNDIRDKIEQASGDPRDVPVVGGEGGAQWLDMGGGAINLNIIEEQKWFFQMCLGALGLGKAEVGLIEDVNRANGEIEATRVYKRVGGPVSKEFEAAMRSVADQFDAYRELGRPFVPKLRFTDPREERAREERLRKLLDSGAITPRQFARRTGDTDIAEDDERWRVTVNGETINYGDHPTWVSKRLMSSAGATDPEQAGGTEASFRARDEEEPY